jgi:membrane protein YdbS with pleckstrin-like domain
MRTPLQKGEKVLLVIHSTWVSLAGPVLLALALIIGGIALLRFFSYGWIISLVAVGFLVVRYFQWKANIWVVTSSRVIDENGFLRHYAKESPLEKINNVSYDQGIWGRILNYGHVEIQTAAQVGATDYYNVHHPKKLKDTITQAQTDLQRSQAVHQASQLAAALGIRPSNTLSVSAELEKLFELKQKGILTQGEYDLAKSKLLNS